MADFKSDSIDAESSYSYIPTGGIVTIAGPFSEYSDTSYVTIGLIPCDGRLLIASGYTNLHSVIGYSYGGSGTSSITSTALGGSSISYDDNNNPVEYFQAYDIPNSSNLFTLENTLVPSLPGYSLLGIGAISSTSVTLIFGNSSTPAQITLTKVASFNVPNLKDNKMTIVGTSSTFYNTNTVGTKLTSYNHSHPVSMSNNDFSMNAANVTHSHNYNFNAIGNMRDANHGHTRTLSAGVMGASQKNGPAGTAGGGLLGNHTHNFGVNGNNFTAVGGADHTHAGGINGNSGNAGDAGHTHSSSATSAANSSASTVDGTVSNPISVPYANVLYFIKA
jgi:hypothetical protein